MKKTKLNSLFIIGLLLFSIVHFMSHSFGMPALLKELLSGSGSALVISGAFKMTFCRSFENSKFRQWKLGLIKKRKIFN